MPKQKQFIAAINLAITRQGEAEEWIQLLPAPNAEGMVIGDDGRVFRVLDPKKIAAEFSRPLPLDINHATELRSRMGEETPAAGWIEALQAREDGSIWGRAEFTESGANAVESKHYRFISPVFLHTQDGTVVRLKSAGLVNNPNFNLALNHSETDTNEESTVKDDIIKLLGLAANASDADVLAAITNLKSTATNAAQPGLDKFVPRADFDAKQTALNAAMQELATIKQAQVDQEIETAINQALKDRKISPATVDYYKAQCATDGGLERFSEFCKQAAPIVGDESGFDERQPENKKGTALNAHEAQVAAMFGNTAEDLAKYANA